MKPLLVLTAHGTDDPAGRQVVRDLTHAVSIARPDLDVRDAYVDVQSPYVATVVASRPDADVTVVPLLLSSGYHLSTDIAEAVADGEHSRHTGPLGPHPLLAEILHDRLREAGAGSEDAVVLAAAGSSRPEGVADAQAMAAQLQALWTGPVTVGFCSAAQPSVADAVAMARARGARRVAVAAYLLGPGFFHRRLEQSGADLITAPLGADPRIVRLVLHRYDDAVGLARVHG
ncbi:sirohydrochlorin chelatase [Calidifontibacter sp. DB0510]|uniref:Sirohydrochlorin chelatase n=1 Tax=Metallococcus carri TaxID=1656884 RepID=A0A967B407_9MICO|nr:CbiX/SirB N-terminal domain-containing protein [Metallococcus carri]NHN57133.1 sirohydrochlorin chelatase [Metallococcus carri]NOP38998.1 sirohydrochlorin chelatase [Calidifontibacter sp. DB2511S]